MLRQNTGQKPLKEMYSPLCQEWVVAGHFIPALSQRALDAAGTPLLLLSYFDLVWDPSLWNGVFYI